MLKRKYCLKSKRDFNKLFKLGKSFYTEGLGIIILKNSFEHPRIGIIISSKVSKKAVVRNKLRRRIKYIFYKYLNKFKNLDIVIITQKSITNNDFKNLEKKILKLFNESDVFRKTN